ncbi:MAG: hypothetical protein ACE5KO_05720, partial [Candidatus Bathyarchaeia archaeon]
MTTLVVLLSKHAVVMGADSLGTEIRQMVNPFRLADYFDSENGLKLRLNDDGSPVLVDFFELFHEAERVPYNQLLHVNKLFRLGNLPIGAMYTGIISIGEQTIRSLLADFVQKDQAFRKNNPPNYTVRSISERLLKYLRTRYEQEYNQPFGLQDLELLTAGYSRNEQFPSLVRINIRKNTLTTEFESGEF